RHIADLQERAQCLAWLSPLRGPAPGHTAQLGDRYGRGQARADPPSRQRVLQASAWARSGIRKDVSMSSGHAKATSAASLGERRAAINSSCRRIIVPHTGKIADAMTVR